MDRSKSLNSELSPTVRTSHNFKPRPQSASSHRSSPNKALFQQKSTHFMPTKEKPKPPVLNSQRSVIANVTRLNRKRKNSQSATELEVIKPVENADDGYVGFFRFLPIFNLLGGGSKQETESIETPKKDPGKVGKRKRRPNSVSKLHLKRDSVYQLNKQESASVVTTRTSSNSGPYKPNTSRTDYCVGVHTNKTRDQKKSEDYVTRKRSRSSPPTVLSSTRSDLTVRFRSEQRFNGDARTPVRKAQQSILKDRVTTSEPQLAASDASYETMESSVDLDGDITRPSLRCITREQPSNTNYYKRQPKNCLSKDQLVKTYSQTFGNSCSTSQSTDVGARNEHKLWCARSTERRRQAEKVHIDRLNRLKLQKLEENGEGQHDSLSTKRIPQNSSTSKVNHNSQYKPSPVNISGVYSNTTPVTPTAEATRKDIQSKQEVNVEHEQTGVNNCNILTAGKVSNTFKPIQHNDAPDTSAEIKSVATSATTEAPCCPEKPPTSTASSIKSVACGVIPIEDGPAHVNNQQCHYLGPRDRCTHQSFTSDSGQSQIYIERVNVQRLTKTKAVEPEDGVQTEVHPEPSSRGADSSDENPYYALSKVSDSVNEQESHLVAASGPSKDVHTIQCKFAISDGIVAKPAVIVRGFEKNCAPGAMELTRVESNSLVTAVTQILHANNNDICHPQLLALSLAKGKKRNQTTTNNTSVTSKTILYQHEPFSGAHSSWKENKRNQPFKKRANGVGNIILFNQEAEKNQSKSMALSKLKLGRPSSPVVNTSVMRSVPSMAGYAGINIALNEVGRADRKDNMSRAQGNDFKDNTTDVSISNVLDVMAKATDSATKAMEMTPNDISNKEPGHDLESAIFAVDEHVGQQDENEDVVANKERDNNPGNRDIVTSVTCDEDGCVQGLVDKQDILKNILESVDTDNESKCTRSQRIILEDDKTDNELKCTKSQRIILEDDETDNELKCTKDQRIILEDDETDNELKCTKDQRNTLESDDTDNELKSTDSDMNTMESDATDSELKSTDSDMNTMESAKTDQESKVINSLTDKTKHLQKSHDARNEEVHSSKQVEIASSVKNNAYIDKKSSSAGHKCVQKLGKNHFLYRVLNKDSDKSKTGCDDICLPNPELKPIKSNDKSTVVYANTGGTGTNDDSKKINEKSSLYVLKEYLMFDDQGNPKKELFGFRRGLKNQYKKSKIFLEGMTCASGTVPNAKTENSPYRSNDRQQSFDGSKGAEDLEEKSENANEYESVEYEYECSSADEENKGDDTHRESEDHNTKIAKNTSLIADEYAVVTETNNHRSEKGVPDMRTPKVNIPVKNNRRIRDMRTPKTLEVNNANLNLQQGNHPVVRTVKVSRDDRLDNSVSQEMENVVEDDDVYDVRGSRHHSSSVDAVGLNANYHVMKRKRMSVRRELDEGDNDEVPGRSKTSSIRELAETTENSYLTYNHMNTIKGGSPRPTHKKGDATLADTLASVGQSVGGKVGAIIGECSDSVGTFVRDKEKMQEIGKRAGKLCGTFIVHLDKSEADTVFGGGIRNERGSVNEASQAKHEKDVVSLELASVGQSVGGKLGTLIGEYSDNIVDSKKKKKKKNDGDPIKHEKKDLPTMEDICESAGSFLGDTCGKVITRVGELKTEDLEYLIKAESDTILGQGMLDGDNSNDVESIRGAISEVQNASEGILGALDVIITVDRAQQAAESIYNTVSEQLPIAQDKAQTIIAAVSPVFHDVTNGVRDYFKEPKQEGEDNISDSLDDDDEDDTDDDHDDNDDNSTVSEQLPVVQDNVQDWIIDAVRAQSPALQKMVGDVMNSVRAFKENIQEGGHIISDTFSLDDDDDDDEEEEDDDDEWDISNGAQSKSENMKQLDGDKRKSYTTLDNPKRVSNPFLKGVINDTKEDDYKPAKRRRLAKVSPPKPKEDETEDSKNKQTYLKTELELLKMKIQPKSPTLVDMIVDCVNIVGSKLTTGSKDNGSDNHGNIVLGNTDTYTIDEGNADVNEALTSIDGSSFDDAATSQLSSSSLLSGSYSSDNETRSQEQLQNAKTSQIPVKQELRRLSITPKPQADEFSEYDDDDEDEDEDDWIDDDENVESNDKESKDGCIIIAKDVYPNKQARVEDTTTVYQEAMPKFSLRLSNWFSGSRLPSTDDIENKRGRINDDIRVYREARPKKSVSNTSASQLWSNWFSGSSQPSETEDAGRSYTETIVKRRSSSASFSMTKFNKTPIRAEYSVSAPIKKDTTFVKKEERHEPIYASHLAHLAQECGDFGFTREFSHGHFVSPVESKSKGSSGTSASYLTKSSLEKSADSVGLFIPRYSKSSDSVADTSLSYSELSFSRSNSGNVKPSASKSLVENVADFLTYDQDGYPKKEVFGFRRTVTNTFRKAWPTKEHEDTPKETEDELSSLTSALSDDNDDDEIDNSFLKKWS